MVKFIKIYFFASVITIILLSQKSYAIDLGYLQCEPDANCVVKIIKILNQKIIIENPVCVTARAACRLKCGPLNDDANRYIRDYEKQINTINQYIVFLNQQKAKSDIQLFQVSQSLETARVTGQLIKEIYQNDLLLNQLISEIRSLSELLENQTEYNNEELGLLIEKTNLSVSTKKLVIYYFKNESLKSVNLNQKILNLEQSLTQPIQYIQLVSLIEVNIQKLQEQLDARSSELIDFSQQLELQNNEVKKLQDKIKEQEDRKCPSKLF